MQKHKSFHIRLFMENKKSSLQFLFTDMLWGAFLSFCFFVLFLLYQISYALDPAAGGLPGGTFVAWLNEVLIDPPLSYDVLITNPTFKKSRKIVDENQNTVVSAKNGKIGIGTEDPSETLEISGISPVFEFTSREGNALFTLKKDDQVFSNILFNTNTSTLSFQNQLSKIEIEKDKKINLTNTLTVQEKDVFLADQLCPQFEYMTGIDLEGKIVCKKI